nr:unnamed protein product [Spirometra erinaceieuropaei]
MNEVDKLTCGVCRNLFRNPYRLPCGHTVCRRPCLLPTPSSTIAICIYCPAEFHESEMRRNYKLEADVQRCRKQESQRVPCYLCRGLYDHCLECPHCQQQLCEFCFKEHVDEFHSMLRMAFQRLADDAHLLKRARQNLISCQAILKCKHEQLVKGLISASNDLLSACQIALSKSEKRLDQIRKKSEKKFDEDTQNTCELNEVALDAVEKLATTEMLDLESHCSEFQNYCFAPGLINISAMLEELSLLVVDEQQAAANIAQTNLQEKSGHQTFSASQTTANIKSLDSNNHNFELKPLTPGNQAEVMGQKALSPNDLIQQHQGPQHQQQRCLQNSPVSAVTAENLMTNVTDIGEVQDVYISWDFPAIWRSDQGYTALRPATNFIRIPEPGHTVSGVPINVLDLCLPPEHNSVGPELNLAPERPFNTAKQMPSVTTISIQQQQQLQKQQKKEQRLKQRQQQKQDLPRHLDIGGSPNALEVSDLAVETIELLLPDTYDETGNRLGNAKLVHLLKFCLKTYFAFDGTIYEQEKDTPMGSPISGLIARAVLQRLESLALQEHKPKFWARYGDCTFIVTERDQVLEFKEHLNAVFPGIQTTMEGEKNNQLAFLDVLVCRRDFGGLKTKVFRKVTNSTKALSYNSNHPIGHKRSWR